jgi:hypothetical protein
MMVIFFLFMLVAGCWLLVAGGLVLVAWCSLLVAWCSLLVATFVAGWFVTLLKLSLCRNLPSQWEQIFVLRSVPSAGEVPFQDDIKKSIPPITLKQPKADFQTS